MIDHVFIANDHDSELPSNLYQMMVFGRPCFDSFHSIIAMTLNDRPTTDDCIPVYICTQHELTIFEQCN